VREFVSHLLLCCCCHAGWVNNALFFVIIIFFGLTLFSDAVIRCQDYYRVRRCLIVAYLGYRYLLRCWYCTPSWHQTVLHDLQTFSLTLLLTYFSRALCNLHVLPAQYNTGVWGASGFYSLVVREDAGSLYIFPCYRMCYVRMVFT
jgi:hypothetical protein